jgi:hypothetical protein
MSKASNFISLFEMLEALGLDMLKADLAGNLKKAGFTDDEVSKIVAEAPSFVAGDEEWTTFLKKAGLKNLAMSRAGMQTDKMKKLSYFMARLKHEV